MPIGFSGDLGSFEESWPVGVWDVPHAELIWLFTHGYVQVYYVGQEYDLGDSAYCYLNHIREKIMSGCALLVMLSDGLHFLLCDYEVARGILTWAWPRLNGPFP